MQRGSAALLVLIVSLLAIGSLIGFVYFHSLKPVPSAYPAISNKISIPTLQPAEASGEVSLQKYEDTELGFEFEYSTDHQAVKPDSEEDYNKRENGNFRKNFTGYVGYEPGEFIKAVAVVNNADGSYRTAPFTIWVFENPNNETAQDFFPNTGITLLIGVNLKLPKKQNLHPFLRQQLAGNW